MSPLETPEEKTLTFEEFSNPEGGARYNNFHGYWDSGSIGYVYRATTYYRRFSQEHPELDVELRQRIRNLKTHDDQGRPRTKTAAMHDHDEILYKAYLIMRDYGLSHHDLFS